MRRWEWCDDADDSHGDANRTGEEQEMSTHEREPAAGDRPRNQDSPTASGTAAPGKKPYSKPVLSKYEQVYGIGLGYA